MATIQARIHTCIYFWKWQTVHFQQNLCKFKLSIAFPAPLVTNTTFKVLNHVPKTSKLQQVLCLLGNIKDKTYLRYKANTSWVKRKWKKKVNYLLRNPGFSQSTALSPCRQTIDRNMEGSWNDCLHWEFGAQQVSRSWVVISVHPWHKRTLEMGAVALMATLVLEFEGVVFEGTRIFDF